MIELFDWLDLFLSQNSGAIGATLALMLMLAIIGAIAEMEG